VLKRETYRGVVVWNKTRKKNDWGKWAPSDRPESEWIRTTVKSLRIIPEPLWRRVQARRKDTEGHALRFEDGRMLGGPRKDGVRNLLVGLATCGVCGGGLVVEAGGKKRGRIPEYICHRQRTNGSCTNRVRVSLEEMNEAVLAAVESHALTPEAIEQVIQLTERDDVQEQRENLSRERKDIEKRIARLVVAVETAGDVASLAEKLRALETRRTAIDRDMASLRPVPRLAPKVVENRLMEWRRLLRQSTTQGRAVLQRIIRGRITFTPRKDGQGYTFRADTRFDKLFAGIVAPKPSEFTVGTKGTWADGGPFDADYGQLLEIVLDGVCARRDLNPRPTGSKPAALSS
jgi:hypothetical protein